MSKGFDFIKNMGKYCVPSLISAILGIVVIPFITEVFPTEEYGKINLFYSMGNTISMFVMLGFDSCYFRFYNEPPKGYNSHRIFKLSIFVSFVVSVAVYLIVLFFFDKQISYYLFGEYNHSLLFGLLLFVLGLVLIKFAGYEFRMGNSVKLYIFSQLAYLLTNRILFVCVAPISTNYSIGNWIIAVSTLISGIFFVILIERKRFLFESPKYIMSKSTIEMLKFGIPLMPTTLIVWLNNSIAKFIYSSFGDFSSIGTFSIATSVANIFSIVPAAFTTYWAPFLYKNYKKEQDFIKQVHDYIMLTSVLLTIAFFVFQDILYMFVNGEYNSSKSIFMLVMINPVMSLLTETTGYGIMFAKKTVYNLYASVVSFLINTIITYIFYNSIGIVGAAVAIAVSSLVQFLIKTWFGQRFYNTINSRLKTAMSIFIILIVATLNLFLCDNLLMRIVVSGCFVFITITLYKACVKEIITLLGKGIAIIR